MCVHVPLIEKSFKEKSMSISGKDFENVWHVNYPFQSNYTKVIYGKSSHGRWLIKIS